MDAAGERAETTCVSKAATTRLHVPDGLRAQASEGVGRDALHVAVLLDVPEQHRQRHTTWPATARFSAALHANVGRRLRRRASVRSAPPCGARVGTYNTKP